jgi:hypothetical protein
MKPLFWEEEHSMQLLNNTHVVWTEHTKVAETGRQHSSYKYGLFFMHYTHHFFQASTLKAAVFPCCIPCWTNDKIDINI